MELVVPKRHRHPPSCQGRRRRLPAGWDLHIAFIYTLTVQVLTASPSATFPRVQEAPSIATTADVLVKILGGPSFMRLGLDYSLL